MKETSIYYQMAMARAFRPKNRMAIVIKSGNAQFAFYDDTIISAKKIDDVDPITRRLPKHTFEFSIADYNDEYNPSNPSGKWESVDENAVVTVVIGLELYDGTTEWLTPDIYYLEGKPQVSNGIASFKAVSTLSILTNKFYKITAGSHTFYELAIAILQDAGVTNYSVSEELKNYTTTAPLPIDTAANLLQMIAHATSCVLTAQRGKITIAPYEIDEIQYDGNPITLQDIAMNGDKVGKIEPLYKVQANRYTYSTEQTKELYKTNISLSGTTTYHCEFQAATNVSISTTATIVSSNIYARAADITLSGNGTYQIIISGKPYTSVVDVAEIIASSDTKGGVDLENNVLVTNEATRTKLLARTRDYLSLRLTHEIQYRGNPEIETLDGIYLQSQYAMSDAIVLSTTLNYNGAISGTIVAKAIQDTASVDLYDANNQQVEDYTGETIKVLGTNDYKSGFTYEQMNEFCQQVLGG